MRGELILKDPDLKIEFDGDIKDLRLASPSCIELKSTTKIRIKGGIQWLINLLRLQ